MPSNDEHPQVSELAAVEELTKIRTGAVQPDIDARGRQMTAGQLWWTLLDEPADRRMTRLSAMLETARASAECFACDHAGRIQELQDTVGRLHADRIQARRYVATLVLAARGSWPGWELAADEVPGVVKEALQEIQRLRAEQAPHPYVWRRGDPPPPAYVMVLHDQADGMYLCRVGYGGTDWQWQDGPNHAYSGPGLAWEACVDGEVHELVHVPGGDL
jgi:hypothetical protein